MILRLRFNLRAVQEPLTRLASRACRAYLACALAGAVLSPVCAAENEITAGQTARLIKAARNTVDDPQGWAVDIHDVLRLHKLPASRENVCAVIAVVDQESNFQPDPAVANLGAISEQALREKLGKIPVAGRLALAWLEKTPTPDTSFMMRIRKARTERDLDRTYRALVDYAGETSNLDVVLRLGLFNKMIEERNDIDTAGSMQVSVQFALKLARKNRWLPMTLDDVYAVREDLYTRHGGLYYGVKQLMDYETGYNRKVFRFADYNAGRYASRNAAFQQAAALLSGAKLATDGDLLSYDRDGKALGRVTDTERAIRKAAQVKKLGLEDSQIRADLLREKKPDFPATRTFLAIRDAAQQQAGKPMPFAVIPEIALSSPKLSRGFSTRRFAESVDRRYQACMQTKLQLKM